MRVRKLQSEGRVECPGAERSVYVVRGRIVVMRWIVMGEMHVICGSRM